MWPEWRYTFRRIKGIHFKVMAMHSSVRESVKIKSSRENNF